jgi:hypothetical protein
MRRLDGSSIVEAMCAGFGGRLTAAARRPLERSGAVHGKAAAVQAMRKCKPNPGPVGLVKCARGRRGLNEGRKRNCLAETQALASSVVSGGRREVGTADSRRSAFLADAVRSFGSRAW